MTNILTINSVEKQKANRLKKSSYNMLNKKDQYPFEIHE